MTNADRQIPGCVGYSAQSRDTGLRGLLAKATVIYPGTTDAYLQRERALTELRALCPDAVALLCDMAEALVTFRRYVEHPSVDAAYDALLARFRELEERPR